MLYINTATLQFGISILDIKTLYPDSSIPLNTTEVGDYVAYAEVDPPTFDPDMKRLVEVPPVQVQGVWTQQWSLVDLTPAELNSRQLEQRASVQHEVIARVQERLDTFAQTRSYDNIVSLASYATSKNVKRQTEGQYGVDARDAHWDKVYEIEAEVLAGTRTLPTADQVMAEMPALVWPAV